MAIGSGLTPSRKAALGGPVSVLRARHPGRVPQGSEAGALPAAPLHIPSGMSWPLQGSSTMPSTATTQRPSGAHHEEGVARACVSCCRHAQRSMPVDVRRCAGPSRCESPRQWRQTVSAAQRALDRFPGRRRRECPHCPSSNPAGVAASPSRSGSDISLLVLPVAEPVASSGTSGRFTVKRL